MPSLIRKIFICIFALIVFLGANIISTDEATAAPKSKKSKTALTQEQITEMNTKLNNLTRKIYANSLFSPEDNESMIMIKLDLDEAMLKTVSAEYAPLYYLEANLLKKRNYKNEAIDCYQTILENFSDTAFAPKARQELLKMGVQIQAPQVESEEDIEE